MRSVPSITIYSEVIVDDSDSMVLVRPNFVCSVVEVVQNQVRWTLVFVLVQVGIYLSSYSPPSKGLRRSVSVTKGPWSRSQNGGVGHKTEVY